MYLLLYICISISFRVFYFIIYRRKRREVVLLAISCFFFEDPSVVLMVRVDTIYYSSITKKQEFFRKKEYFLAIFPMGGCTIYPAFSLPTCPETRSLVSEKIENLKKLKKTVRRACARRTKMLSIQRRLVDVTLYIHVHLSIVSRETLANTCMPRWCTLCSCGTKKVVQAIGNNSASECLEFINIIVCG